MRETAKAIAGLALVLSTLVPLPTGAQQAERAPVPHQHVISGGPLLLLAGGFNAEYERKVNESLTVGIAAGWLDTGEEDYTGVSGFVRFYPQRAAFSGYYLGSRAGFFKVDEGSASHTAFGIGVDLGYAWILGPGGSIYVGLGLGAVRLVAGDLGTASKVIPQLRLLDIGVSF